MAAGIAMLTLINETPDFYSELERKAAKLESGIRDNLAKSGIKGVINRVGSMMTLFFTNETRVTTLEEALKSDTKMYADYFKMTLESGIYVAPSQFESLFVSYAHTDRDIDTFLSANLSALRQLQ